MRQWVSGNCGQQMAQRAACRPVLRGLTLRGGEAAPFTPLVHGSSFLSIRPGAVELHPPACLIVPLPLTSPRTGGSLAVDVVVSHRTSYPTSRSLTPVVTQSRTQSKVTMCW